MKRKTIIMISVMATAILGKYESKGQGMAVNTTGTAANSSAMLDVSSTSQGMLLPRMTFAQRTAISSPATGLLVYQTDATAGFYYNSGTPGSPVWTWIGTPATATLQGNSFNGANQLVQLNASAQLPAISGANLTSLNAANLTGTLPAISGANLTSLNGANITNNTITVNKINTSSGSASSSTFLRGDGTWNAPAGGMTRVTYSAFVTKICTAGNSSYTATTSDEVIFVNLASAGTTNFTINLPAASSMTGKVIIVKMSKPGPSFPWIIVDPNGGELVDDGATSTITGNYQGKIFLSDGTGWWTY